VTVAAAAASGLGVLGFVVFAGGVVLWRRFSEMGLPADHAVALIPKSELVATGAEFLVPALLLTVLMMLVLVMFGGRVWAWRTAFVILLVEIIVALSEAERVHDGTWVLLGVALVGFVVLGRAGRLRLAAFSLVAFLTVGTFWIVRDYELTSHAPSVIPLAYSRAQPGTAPRVEIGYFVAETSDRIFFASLPQPNRNKGLPNELRSFTRSETDDLEVGALTPVADAEARASKFALNLCLRLRALTRVPRVTHETPPCSNKYIEELKKAS
jgi:hypothetical protein